MPSSAGHHRLNRRVFLKSSLGVSAGLIAAPTLATMWQASAAEEKAATAFTPFVDDYTTNITANLTPETNAVVRVLGGFAEIWKTGGAWNTGTPLLPEILRANMRYCARVTAAPHRGAGARGVRLRPAAPELLDDRRPGPARGAVPDGRQGGHRRSPPPPTAPRPTTISDAVPADAPAGSALGAGVARPRTLGQVAKLVDTVRGPFASGNPAKFAFQYPRPWRMNEDSEVVDTGATDELGFPVYESEVVVVTQLLRQRGKNPAEDGGFPSGHTNAFHLAALAFAYAVPERFQEMVTRAFELSHTRIIVRHALPGRRPRRPDHGHRAGRRRARRPEERRAQGRRAQAGRRVLPGPDRHHGRHAVRLRALGRRTDPYADREANLPHGRAEADVRADPARPRPRT